MFFNVCSPRSSSSNVDFASRVLLDTRRSTNAARLRDCLKPCGDVDAVTKNVATLVDNVADMNSDPEVEAPIRSDETISRSHFRLDCDCAADGLHHTVKLDIRPSPVVLTMRPRCLAISGSNTSLR